MARDAYEAQYIQTPGEVVHRDKNVAKGAILAMLPMALIALTVTIALALGADPAASPTMAIIPGLWFAWTVYMMLTKVSVRSVLTRELLEVHWGMSRTKVPVAAITHCEVQSFDRGVPMATFAMKSWGPKGWVLVRWKDDAGKDKAAQFPAGDPAALVAQIQQLRTGEARRVAGDASDHASDAEALAEAEAEALAEAEAEVAERQA